MKKLLLILIIFLFSTQNYSYAKLIEFEKCYNGRNILNSNETDIEKPENLKWSEEHYKIRNTYLYHTFDPKNYDKIIKKPYQSGKLGEKFDRSFSSSEIGLKKRKTEILDEIKELEKQGFNKIFPATNLIFSISTSSGIITRTIISSEDFMIAARHQEEWYNLRREKEGKRRVNLNVQQITNLKYKIDNLSGGIIQGTEITSFEPQKIAIDIKKNLITLINENRLYDKQSDYLICKSSSGLQKSNNFTDYWWAVVLVAAVIFFIYTQTKNEIGGNNKKDKKNLLRSFLAFLKKNMARKNKIIIKEKKIEQKNSSKSENLFIKFLEGKKSLAYSFWFMYTAITSINLIISYILKVSNLLFVAGLFFIFQWCYFIFATIGTWRSATNYKINKESKNEGAGWAIAVYIYLVISILTSIFRTIKSFG